MSTFNIRSQNGRCKGRKSVAGKIQFSLIILSATASVAFGQGTFTPLYFGALYPVGLDVSDISISATAEPDDPNSQTVTGLTATIVTDDASYDVFNSPTWYSASGTTVSLANGTIAPGVTGVPWGGPTLSLNPDQWILISCTLDGVQDYQGYEVSGGDINIATVKEGATFTLVPPNPPGYFPPNPASGYNGTIKGTFGNAVPNTSNPSVSATATGADGNSATGNGGTVQGQNSVAAGWYVNFNNIDPTKPITLNFSANGVANLTKNINYEFFVPAPEPSTLALFGAGALSLLGSKWRRANAKA